ncbi:unnamed protein product [Brassica oleracea var. botrytis]
MEAIDLNNDGQNDVMDEDIEDSEANRGTQPRQVQSRRRVSRCWKKFTILGGRLSDGTTKIRCNLLSSLLEDQKAGKECFKTVMCYLLYVIHLLPQLGFQVSLGLSSLLFMLSALIRLG